MYCHHTLYYVRGKHDRRDSDTHGTSSSDEGTACLLQRADLQEKLGEIETFRGVLCRQLDTLQTYFDAQGGMSSQHQGQTSTQSFTHSSIASSRATRPSQ